MKEYFSQYGDIEEVQILKKANGTHVGCAFVQFKIVQNAAKAIHHSNLKPLLDREIIVDWAVPKKKFDAAPEVKHEEIDITEETEGNGKSESDIPLVEVKEEVVADEEKGDIVLEDDYESIKSEEYSSGEDENSTKSEEENEDKDDEKMIIKEKSSSLRRISNDVSEGRTVFLKNIPFQAKNEDLKACMEQFGPVFYALVCVDSLTEHSKGTAFVKFRVITNSILKDSFINLLI